MLPKRGKSHLKGSQHISFNYNYRAGAYGFFIFYLIRIERAQGSAEAINANSITV
jgi:hypothetical protein